jgi:hypothetical protein
VAQPLIGFASARLRTLLIVTLIIVCVFVGHAVYTVSLHRTHFFSGWALLVLLLGLTAYHARKKLPFLPLGSASTWMQFHAAAGFLSMFLFVLHIGFHVPHGILEVTLAALYLVVAGSGLVGLALSNMLPRRLTTRGEEVVFERIPAIQRNLREQIEAVLLRSVSESGPNILSDFYLKRLKGFFEGPRHFWYHLIESRYPLHALDTDVGALDRYLDPSEREITKEVRNLVRRKDDLDYHYALQAVLKYWLFVHIPLSYGLLIISLLHGALVYAFLRN